MLNGVLRPSSVSHFCFSSQCFSWKMSPFFFSFVSFSFCVLPLMLSHCGSSVLAVPTALPSPLIPPRAAGLLLHAHMKASDEAEVLLTALGGSGRSAVLILLYFCSVFFFLSKPVK